MKMELKLYDVVLVISCYQKNQRSQKSYPYPPNKAHSTRQWRQWHFQLLLLLSLALVHVPQLPFPSLHPLPPSLSPPQFNHSFIAEEETRRLLKASDSITHLGMQGHGTTPMAEDHRRCRCHQLHHGKTASTTVSANPNDSISTSKENSSHFKKLRNIACGVLAVLALTTTSPVIAANQRLPPLSTDPERCERAFVGNTIGQANGVYDKAIDLRFCDYTNDKTNLKGKSLAAALMSDAKFDGADMTEVIMSKAYAVGASFKGTDFTNAVLDRVNFGKANLQGASFKNTVLSGSTFEGAQLQDVVFEDTIIGYIDLQKLCVNKTINEDSRLELGCRN
ncbi:unnamed protein product [Lactuca saligna]|uniref:Thylakoid lumenal 17.4 kDa protein, chloroplastic n=1 Tax=Lactuca saligna TaxID=75948 RepID=A0AA36ENR9_LACSI|nr:unnamed protein product [Lactuca saligna]